VTFAIAAAGTGGHVFPGLAVGEALVDLGVSRSDVVYVGGDRLESTVFPEAGFPFVRVDVRGLQRSLTPANLAVPWLVVKARKVIKAELRSRGVAAALGFGNYVTVPFGWAAHSAGIPFFVAEQNAHAGLANRVAQRWARDAFVSFPDTTGLTAQTLTGNPIRRELATFDRAALRGEALAHFDLQPGLPTVGVFGGSLGAGAINEAVADMILGWSGPPIQVLHLVGTRNIDRFTDRPGDDRLTWRVVGFESRMELFFAACDLIVARSGGGVAEVTATATPALLVPGGFGSGGHQDANAARVGAAGAAVVVPESSLEELGPLIRELLDQPDRRKAMTSAARAYAHPDAARTIATRLMEAAGA
jgi:UDP-N-acetylglucosamine--N-acetylmuramyl-(pentapeptide) pyrophosphoryl-undecaprenol N-acetylglucosamine transferase